MKRKLLLLIFSYDKAVGGEGKEKYREYSNKERYNLDSLTLNPLKFFLNQRLISKENKNKPRKALAK